MYNRVNTLNVFLEILYENVQPYPYFNYILYIIYSLYNLPLSLAI